MKRLSICLYVFAIALAAYAQPKADPYYLTEYAFIEGLNEVGTLMRNDGVEYKLHKIKGEAAKLLYVDGNMIRIKEQTAYKLFERDRWNVTLEVRVGKQRETVDFMLVRDEFISNGVVAHRGFWGEGVPQNSIAALKRAVELGCGASEFDVRITSDGQVVVNHDADYQGVVIQNTTYDEVRKLKLPNGETIPSLREYLEEGVKQNKTRLVLELKGEQKTREEADRYVSAVLKDIKLVNAQEWVVFITFNRHILESLLHFEPLALIGYLNGDLSPSELKHIGCRMLNYNKDTLRKNLHWFEEARRVAVSMNVWTVNTPEDMQFFMDRNVLRITTDHPDVLINLKKQK